MTTDDLYSNNNSVNMDIPFCVKRFELCHVMDIALQKCYVLSSLLVLVMQPETDISSGSNAAGN